MAVASYADVTLYWMIGEPGGADLSMGDVTGDGLADLVVGVTSHDDAIRTVGAYVLPGPLDGLMLVSDGIPVLVGNVDGGVGGRVDATGDINGDGVDDLVVNGPAEECCTVNVFYSRGVGIATTSS